MRGKVLDNTYLLLEEIGRGGFGAVYRAVRLGLEGSGAVAIKLLNNNRNTPVGEAIRFQREATFLSQLMHPGIVTVHELGEETDTYYIVMEFVAGSNLREFVTSRGGKLGLNEVLSILIQAAEALEYVHAHGIIHRDIKPHNILICEHNDGVEKRTQAKLVDFGVARIAHLGGARTESEVVGTYSYMAPEATGLVDWKVDERSDIYSLGMVAFELLAGKSAFAGLKKDEMLHAHVHTLPPNITEISGFTVPAGLNKIVLKCLAKSPDERYQSMFGLVCDLKEIRRRIERGITTEDFVLGEKDFGIDKALRKIFVGKRMLVDDVVKFHEQKKSGRLAWALLKGGVGTGKTRILQEIKNRFEVEGRRFLHLKFNESEQRLPYQALGFAINDYLSQFEKQSNARFRDLAMTFAKRLGETAPEIARLIPAFRPYLKSDLTQTISVPALSPSEGIGALGIEFGEKAQRDLSMVRVYQTFFELFVTLAGKDSLVFLLDDVHLADTSTLALLQFLAQQINQDVNFGFVMTARDRYGRHSLVYDEFMKAVAGLKRRFVAWQLEAFTAKETQTYLEELGLRGITKEVVEFFHSKSKGTPLQLVGLLKRTSAEGILFPVSSSSESLSLQVKKELLSKLNLDFQSVAMQLAQLETMEKRDLHLLQVAAIANEACEFDYFAVDPEFSEVELEARLQGILNRGYLELIGDPNAPLRRRAFVFSHEKLRNAVLSGMDAEVRREIHYRLAMRIMSLYRSPRREQILALAKHFDGAGKKAEGRIVSKSFLRAVRVYIQSNEYSLARYYIDKTLERVTEIENMDERLQRLREVYEAEYTIYASQGNLIAASEVCRQLLDITYDPIKKQSLQIFWCQLLLGLGRHAAAFREAQGLASVFYARTNLFTRILIALHFLLIGNRFYKKFCGFARRWNGRNYRAESLQINALSLMAISQFHGHESDVRPTLYYAMKVNVLGSNPSRWTAAFAFLYSGILLRSGQVQKAYQLAEQAEKYLEASGISDALRWARVLKALWLDYPMGRFERILPLFHFSKEGLLPSSGVLHFEGYGLRAWLRLVAPGATGVKDVVRKEELKRRKADKGDHKLLSPQRTIEMEGVIENNNARRILDAGENGQYTAFALYSDSIRFALSHRLESLRRTVEQLKRQPSHHATGEVFARLSYSMQALLTGRSKEALNHYLMAMQIVSQLQPNVASLAVIDGVRFGTLLLPLLAVSINAKGWPWGKNFATLLAKVDAKLTLCEGGKKSPRRTAIASLYKGFHSYFRDNRSEAFTLIEQSIKEARTQKTELVECFALSALGTFCAASKIPRAANHLADALKLAHQQRWKLLARQIHGVLKRTGLEIQDDKLEGSVDFDSISGASSMAVNHVLLRMQRLTEMVDVEDLLGESLRIACGATDSQSGFAYLLESGRNKFSCRANFSKEGRPLESSDERKHSRWLSRNLEEPVRFIKLVEEQKAAGVLELGLSHTEDTVPKNDSTFADDGGTQVMEVEVQSNRYLVLIALSYGSTLLGWLVLPEVRFKSGVPSAQVEQDLLLLGLHVGHLLNKRLTHETQVRSPAMNLASAAYVDKKVALLGGAVAHDIDASGAVQPQELVLPRGVTFEVWGESQSANNHVTRTFVVRNRRVMLAHWRFKSKKSKQARLLTEMVGRHLEFYVHSLSQRSDFEKLELVMKRLFMDLCTLFENVAKTGRLDEIDMNIVIVDPQESRSIEADFGSEFLSFVGQSEIENEHLSEVLHVLSYDRLVYREKTRKISQTVGWFVATSDRSKAVLPRFARFETLEKYQVLKREGRPLAKLLELEERAGAQGVALFFNPEESDR